MQNMFVGIDIEQLKLTQRVPLVEQERPTLPEHTSLLHDFSTRVPMKWAVDNPRGTGYFYDINFAVVFLYKVLY
jgi:hypothetical protein